MSFIKNKENVCPVCGSRGNLNYGVLEPTDSGVMRSWNCLTCSSHGEEHYNLEFIMHLGVVDKDLNSYSYDEFKDAYYKVDESDSVEGDNKNLENSGSEASMITIDVLSLDMNTLRSKQELIDYLTENGSTHSALMDFCDEYRELYRNELCWAYPISDGKHLGTFLVLVREGILSLPYDGADKENYELFCLEDVRMFDAMAMGGFIEDWNRFSENLQAVMLCMRNYLSDCKNEDGEASDDK